MPHCRLARRPGPDGLFGRPLRWKHQPSEFRAACGCGSYDSWASWASWAGLRRHCEERALPFKCGHSTANHCNTCLKLFKDVTHW